MSGFAAPILVLGLSCLVLFAPSLAAGARSLAWLSLAAIALLHAFAITTGSGVWAFAAIAGVSALRAIGVAGSPRAPRATAWVVVLAAGIAATGLAFALPVLAFAGSLISIMLLAGAAPLHRTAARVIESSTPRMTEQLATSIIVVFAHIKFVAPLEIAHEVAPMVVRVGAVLALLPALTALVQPDLRGFYRSAIVMHGGMLVTAVGASGFGHAAAALLVSVTMSLALGGLGVMVASLEERAGLVALSGRAGRISAFPRLAAAFLLFAAAGVGMPGTAGFIADDILLHALWEESVAGSLIMVVASSLLAVATLMTFARVFLGPPTPSLAPDLRASERGVAIILVVVLIGIGVVPSVLLDAFSNFMIHFGARPH